MSFSFLKPVASAVGTLGVRLPQTTNSITVGLPTGRSFSRVAPALSAAGSNRGCYRREQARYHVQCRRALAFCPPPLKSW